MSSKNNFFSSIAFKSTFRYTFIFTFFLLLAFGAIYVFVARYIQNIEDDWLLKEAKQLNEISKKPNLKNVLLKMKEGTKALGTYQVFYCLREKNGKLLACTDKKIWEEILTMQQKESKGNFFIETLHIAQGQHPLRIIHFPAYAGRMLEVVYSLKNSSAFLNRLLWSFVFMCPFMVFIFGILGYIMMKNILEPMHTMTKIANEITLNNINKRIPIKHPKNELGILADTLNNMLSRINTLVNNIKEMCDNLAHDIRTPITRIQGSIEVTLMQERSKEEYCEALEYCTLESQELLHWLNTLLDISETEAKISLQKEKFLINDLLDDVVEMFEPIAQEKGIEFYWQEVSEKMYVYGDIKKLRRVVVNLVDNAIKYTKAGKVTIGLVKKNSQIWLLIKDTGIGIPNEDLKLIFNRFYRSDASRSLPGSGLGLALVKAIIDAHEGKIIVNSKVDHGSIFRISLSTS